jgi:hypothetical protein
MKRTLLLTIAAALSLSIPGGAFAADPGTDQPATTPEPTVTTTVLSNEKTLTRSAGVVFAGIIRAQPRADAHALGRLHQLTEDGYPEVYLALRSQTDANGTEWTQIRIPGRPNGRVGWVLRDALGPYRTTNWRIVVNRKTLRMTVFWNGKVRKRMPVGVGKHSTPTPGGRFWIREKIRVRDTASPYWPYALGTANYSTLSEWPGGGVVGIHGDWNQPQLIPGRPSHGCIRMRDRDVAWVARHVPVGTPLRIL